ncbi:MAG: hypothetical protein AB1742_03775 [bacterium]
MLNPSDLYFLVIELALITIIVLLEIYLRRLKTTFNGGGVCIVTSKERSTDNEKLKNQSEVEYAGLSENERTLARMKSYTGAAVLVFVLYWFFWLPGLIVNYIYMKEAERMEKLAGQRLPGTGCLTVMFAFGIAVTAISVFIGIVIFSKLFIFFKNLF